MNFNCKTGYLIPFNNPYLNLTSWTLDANMRANIMKAGYV
jgi:hypothetical protein